MQSYVDNGQMAPMTLFYNGPANWNFVNLMSSFYGTGYTPSFFCDGVFEQIGWNQTACQNAINSRLAVPSVLDIGVSIAGDASSGLVYYDITAEEDLQSTGMVRLYSVIFENDIYCASGWGGYTGKTVNWIPRMSPVGVTGVALDFTGPYPQTVSAMGEYTIDPGWEYDNLGIITFVLDYSNKEVFNASYHGTLTEVMGIEEGPEALSLRVGPNPSTGSFSTFCTIPQGTGCTVEVFDVTGRRVAFGSPESQFTVAEAGLYVVRLVTDTGDMLTETVAVTR